MEELPPSQPLPLSHGMPGCALGLVGMFLYGLGVQIAARDVFTREYKISSDTGPILAGIGCALFCVSIALIWRLSMKTLVILVVISGVMIWGVTTVRQARGDHDRTRGQYTAPYVQPIPAGGQPTPANPATPGGNTPVNSNDVVEPETVEPGAAKDSPPAR